MSWRLPARLVTGPLAFLLGGVIDLMIFAWTTFRARMRAGSPK